MEEAISSTQRETRRYAKRQLTWFRKEKEVLWFNGFGSDTTLVSSVFRQVENFFKTTTQQDDRSHPFRLFEGNRTGKDGHEIEANGK